MEVKNNTVIKKLVLEVGDVVGVNGSLYHVDQDSRGKYIAKGFDGVTGSTGYWDTLAELQKSLENHRFTHYSQREYKLVLEAK